MLRASLTFPSIRNVHFDDVQSYILCAIIIWGWQQIITAQKRYWRDPAALLQTTFFQDIKFWLFTHCTFSKALSFLISSRIIFVMYLGTGLNATRDNCWNKCQFIYFCVEWSLKIKKPYATWCAPLSNRLHRARYLVMKNAASTKIKLNNGTATWGPAFFTLEERGHGEAFLMAVTPPTTSCRTPLLHPCTWPSTHCCLRSKLLNKIN